MSASSSQKSVIFRRVSQHSLNVEYMHSFENESHKSASTKECRLVSIGILILDDIDLAKNVKFSQISQRQDACGMSLLKTNSLCCFRNLYGCLKVNSFSKILTKSSVSLWITSEHVYLIFFSGVGVGYVESLHKFTQPFNLVFTKIVAWTPWTFVIQNDAQINFF